MKDAPEQLSLPIASPCPGPEPGRKKRPGRNETYRTATQVARMLKVEPHVLRYWETKFEIKPERNSAGRRIYREEQIEKLKRIKFLRYGEKLTIQGAKRKIVKLQQVDSGKSPSGEGVALLLWLKEELIAIRDLLADDE